MTLNTYQNILNNLPEDWETKKFSELGQVISGGTPSRDNPAFWHGDIPWLTPGEISSNAVKYLTETEEKISSSGLNGSGANLLPEKSLMITSRATLGARVINTVPMTTNQGFKNVVFYDTDDAGFYYYLLELVKPEMFRRASGTTFLEISSKEFSDIELPVPTKKERMIIEKTFDTLDTTIRQTEAIIAKLQRVKKGLLHDLLTRGIDDSGQLRPPQHLAPELYKESPLGWIPKEWGVDEISNLSIGGLMNGVFKEPARVGHGVPLVNVADLYRGQEVDLNKCELFGATKAEIERYGIEKGDIFFTRSSLKLEGIAQTSFVDSDPANSVFECHVMRLRPNSRIINARFLKEWCVSSYARTHFMSHAKQVTMTTISQDGIKTLLCPVPSLAEQNHSIDRVNAIDTRISDEQKKSHKLIKQKSGLMNDLLTGKVRVTSLL